MAVAVVVGRVSNSRFDGESGLRVIYWISREVVA